MRIGLYHFTLWLFLTWGSTTPVCGQMLIGEDTLIGNEWIRYGQQYFKFTVSEDGIYRIPSSVLDAAGLGGTTGDAFRLYSMGRQVPLYVSTPGIIGSDDFIEFYGYKNDGEMDRYLYRHPDADMLNPAHSLYSDQRPYYLTTSGDEPPLRVKELINDISTPPAAEPYYLHTERINYNAAANDPYYPISGGGAISYSSYLHAEGFGKASETNSTVQLNTPERATGPDAILHLRLATTNYTTHRFILRFNGNLVDTLYSTEIQIRDTSYTIPLSWLQDVNDFTITSINSQSRQSLVTIALTYPRLTQLSGLNQARMTLDDHSGDQYIVLDGFQHGTSEPIVYTADGSTRMVTTIGGDDKVHFLWPDHAQSKSLLIVDPTTSIHAIGSLQLKIFEDLSGDNTEYVVITHPDLMEIGTGSAYIQYRSSPEGGGYRAKAYSILDLYEQFGYGIEKHPQAIRNFVDFMQRHWSDAKMIFIIGRGIEYHRSRYTNGTWESLFFVPTFGRPGADNLLAATLWDLVPRYPIGRLAITDPQAIDTYLSKVKAHDLSRYTGQTLEDKQWIKNVMHIGGGKTSTEQVDFENTLQALGNELAASGYGADIHFFQKRSTEIIGETESAQVLNLLHQGCSIINYLGHSATSSFEYNINDPSEWNNKDRYPIFSAMGCSAGQIHGIALSLSDNYIRIPDEGVVAFISGSGSQFASALEKWAEPWYDYFGNLNYGCTLGESILFGLHFVSNYVNVDLVGSNSYRYLLEQQTFQGDPALQLHPLPGPDYMVDRNSISFSPNQLETKQDSFDLTFTAVNIGRNLGQKVPYSIRIALPDGQENLLIQDTLSADSFRTTVVNHLPLLTGGKSGAYRLLITLDPTNTVSELPTPDAENNNELTDNLGVKGIAFFVIDNLLTAVYPPDFSIVTTPDPELVATGTNAFSASGNVIFEIDTTPFFDSPGMVRQSLHSQSSTVKWTPQVNWIADQVYYWRVSPDSLSPEQSFAWSRRSFIYKPGSSPGWNQSEFHQLTDNDFPHLLADSTARTFTFDSKSRNFNILNRFQDVVQGLIPRVIEEGVILAEFFTGFRERNVQVFVVAIDSLTGNYMYNPNPGLYGSYNHLAFDAKCFAYRSDLPESRQALIHFVEDIIPAGYFVFFYTYQRPSYPDYFPELWAADEAEFGESIFSMIEKQYPGSAIRTLAETGSKPYIVFFQKDRGGIRELIAADSSDVISMNYDIKSSLSQGSHISRLIGPASQWYAIQSATHSTAPDTAGQNIMSAIALSTDLSDTLVISRHLTNQDTAIADIDAQAWPFIQLNYTTQDSVTYDPADILYWRVLYEGVPELVVQPDLGFEFIADTLNRGDTMQLLTYLENVSPYDVDTLPVSLRITSADNTTDELKIQLFDVNGHSAVPVIFSKSTSSYAGDYQVLMEANPGRPVPELNYNNNIGILPMFVRVDNANPVLDVTFDGYHIQDGDLVSASPLIRIQLLDENENLRLDDTSSFEMYIEYPSDFNARRIYFSTPWVHFIPSPATGKNIAYVELTPDFNEDGIYTLQVNARDASGNAAGDNDYRVSFEVIQDKSVSYIYNYPNPFSTSTRFIYTLTGPGAPASYGIEIRSLTGILVREISSTDMGPLVPGQHMTEYVWDGTDQNGNLLPAGLYLYRLVAHDEDGVEYERYVPYGQSDYENKGWGKLIMVR